MLVWVPRGGTVVPIWGESSVTSDVMGRLPVGAEAALRVLEGGPAASDTADETAIAAVAVTERQRAVAAITMTGAASDADRTALRIAAGDLSV